MDLRNLLLTTSLALAAFLLVLSPVSAATVTLRPDGIATNSAWTNTGCSSGASEWQCVDEATVNTSDYLSTTGTGKETFSFSNSGLVGNTINSVTIYYYAQRVAAADACFSAMIRSGTTDYLGGTQICTTANYTLYSRTYTINPATNASWTVTEVDALQAGMYGLNPNGGGRVAQVYAVVDYNASVCGNGVRETGELCDGTQLGTGTCSNQGFSGGNLTCTVSCTYDTSACYTNTCSDSDGGFTYGTQGSTSGNFSGAPYVSTDVCIDMTFLTEYFCSGGNSYTTVKNCANNTNATNYTGCSMGACV